MNTIERVKKILLSPKTEWSVIDAEEMTSGKLLTSYLILLALIPAVAGFIGFGLIGYNVLGSHIGSVSVGIRQSVITFAGIIASTYITAFIVNWLAPKFGSRVNFHKAFQLVAYSYTPLCVAGILYIIPALGTLAGIVGLYGLYILFVGLAPMMQTPEDKTTPYFLSTIVCVIVISILLSVVLGAFYAF